MKFNLNEFLMAISFALDFVEMDILGVSSQHSKRTALISVYVGKELGLTDEGLSDLVALSILHDNGASGKSIHDEFFHGEIRIKQLEVMERHCIIGEENIKAYPFLTDVTNIIKYHHEKYDGSGFNGIKGEEIPLMAQIIHLADSVELNFDLRKNDEAMKESVYQFVKSRRGKDFSPRVVDAFLRLTEGQLFWESIKRADLKKIITSSVPEYTVDLPIERIRGITKVLSKIIDAKSQYTYRHSSGLAEKVGIMADYYQKGFAEKMQLIIAADLHDIGKLAVSNGILDSPNKLSQSEFEVVKKHPYHTRLALQEIKGFEQIADWASNHHEKLDGTGYPYGLTGDELDFNSRLMACLDIYQAITEDRPYRKGLDHEVSIGILREMDRDGLIDGNIVKDIDAVFGVTAKKEVVLV